MDTNNKLGNNATVSGCQYNHRSLHAKTAMVEQPWKIASKQNDIFLKEG